MSIWSRLLTSMFGGGNQTDAGEKVRALPGAPFNLMPRYDWVTDETPQMRDEYRKMLRDPVVYSAIKGKITSVAAEEQQWHPYDHLSYRDNQIAEFCEYAVNETPSGWVGLITGIILGGLIEGFSVSERVWADDLVRRGKYRGKRIYASIKSKDPRAVQLVTDPYRNTIGVRAIYFNGSVVYDPEDFIIFSHFPIFENPAGFAAMRTAYRAYWIKDTLWKLRAIFLEKYAAGGLLMGKYLDDTQKVVLENAMAAAKSGCWISFREGCSIDVKDLSARGTSDFESAIHDCDKEILIGISGAFLQSMEGSNPNSPGDSKVQKQTTNQDVWYLTECVRHVLKRQYIPALVDMNYWDADYPDLTIGTQDDAQLLSSLSIDQGLHGMGLPLDREEMYKRYGRKMPVDITASLPGSPAPPVPTVMNPGQQSFTATFAEEPRRDGVEAVTPRPVAATASIEQTYQQGVDDVQQIAEQALLRLIRLGGDTAMRAEKLFDTSELELLAQAIGRGSAAASLMGADAARQQIEQQVIDAELAEL